MIGMGRRILVTGLGTYWGSRIAQALEHDPGVELVVGVDRSEEHTSELQSL